MCDLILKIHIYSRKQVVTLNIYCFFSLRCVILIECSFLCTFPIRLFLF